MLKNVPIILEKEFIELSKKKLQKKNFKIRLQELKKNHIFVTL